MDFNKVKEGQYLYSRNIHNNNKFDLIYHVRKKYNDYVDIKSFNFITLKLEKDNIHRLWLEQDDNVIIIDKNTYYLKIFSYIFK